MKPRNHAFDFLCGICIIRMVSYHVMLQCGHANELWWKEMMHWSYFFMSFFFFKAGYFNKTVLGVSSIYCKDKAKRLFIPYLTTGLMGNIVYFSLLFVLYYCAHYSDEPISKYFRWSHIWKFGNFYGNNPNWFLLSFFSAYIGIHFLEKLRFFIFRNTSPVVLFYSQFIYIVFPLAGYLLFVHRNPIPFQLSNVFMGIFFFELGHWWNLFLEKYNTRTSISVSLILILCFVIINFCNPDILYSMKANAFVGNKFFLTIFDMVAILCGLSGLLISLHLPRVPLINYIGEHSMVFFITHYPIIFYYKFIHLSFGYDIVGRYDDVLILLFFLFGFCAWLVPYIELVPWLSGRWPKKE